MSDDTFTPEEQKQIVEMGFHYDDAFENDLEKFDASVVFEGAMLGAALFAAGTDMTDDDIVESFAETLKQARKLMEVSEDEDEEEGGNEDEDEEDEDDQ